MRMQKATSTVRVIGVQTASAGYEVVVGFGAIAELGDWGRARGFTNLVVVSDETVNRLHGERLRAVLGSVRSYQTVPAGEGSKSLESIERLAVGLAAAEVDRDATMIAFGGGMVTDLGGFLAAVWHRGIRVVLAPTTLEAMIDAAIGGKTAVNLPAGKNLIGAFHQPVRVVADLDFLATLPQRDFVAALAESVKHGAIRDGAFLEFHERSTVEILAREPAAVEALVCRNVEIKAAVVAADEREAGVRAILNYGHTIGHAIELVANYALRHGECVGLGMIAENAIAVGRGLLAEEAALRIRDLLAKFGLPVRVGDGVNIDDVIAAARRDKKNRGGGISIVTLRGVGDPIRLDDVSEREIRDALSAIA